MEVEASGISSGALHTRRAFLARTATGLAGLGLASRWGLSKARAAVPGFEILETKVISQQAQYYHGWPTVTRRRNGELWVVWSGGREEHVCPFGQVVAMTSRDEGKTWTWPRVLLDGAIDDRDAGVLETGKGSLLVTTFTSLAYAPNLEKQLRSGQWPAEKLARWRGVHERLTAAEREKQLGQWMLRSTDGGTNWSAPFSCLVNSPHGPIQLRDGRLLYPGKELWTGDKRVGVAESDDDGQSWRWLATIPVRPGDAMENYHELHGVECADGRILVQIRNHNETNNRETLQCESTDGGKTWTTPRAIGVWGLPSHLLRLRDDSLLMSYGHRRAPLGNQARLSRDHGQTWSEAVIISGDGTSGDLGYPSTVQLGDDSLLTIWYERLKQSPNAVLRQARWRLV
ncbi:MAG: exo-alpha-sialidase [Verrucomicrobia bacterium]|nr:exo-alpha-sialidase [Verrucomicrobiota bacterium]